MGKKIQQINNIIQNQKWFDFEVYNYSHEQFIIKGSSDFSVGHQLEIYFEGIYHLTINDTWKTDTSGQVIIELEDDELDDFVEKYGLEENISVYKIISEDYFPFYIAAQNVSFKQVDIIY